MGGGRRATRDEILVPKPQASIIGQGLGLGESGGLPPLRDGKRVVVVGLSELDSRFENNWMRRWRVDAGSGTLRGTVTTSTKPGKGVVLDRAARRGGIWT